MERIIIAVSVFILFFLAEFLLAWLVGSLLRHCMTDEREDDHGQDQ